MAIFYHSLAEPDRDVLKLLIRGYVQANSASRRQRGNWIGAAELEWAKVRAGALALGERRHSGILYNKIE